MDAKYNPGSMFQGNIVNKNKNETWALPKVATCCATINIYENLHNYIRVTKVCFLKKKEKGDRFANFNMTSKT